MRSRTQRDIGNPAKWRSFDDRRYYVLNETDGLLASENTMTLEQAAELIRRFHTRFRKQGYYVTSKHERISPHAVELRLIDADSDEGRGLTPTEARFG